jgi:RNA polymerase sigma-70 factor (ECF subfamily)
MEMTSAALRSSSPVLAMHPLTEDAFARLLEKHRNELRLHCYRMLGSSHDSDDMVQETATRAWRARESVKDASSSRAWLYRIATNVCLDELGRRKARHLSFETGLAAADPRAPIAAPDPEALLEPCPDAWLAGGDPSSRYEAREAVAIAFIAAIHHLTAPQRAALLLRDVVGFSAEETAAALELGLEATNSALFRARRAVEDKVGDRDRERAPRDEGVEAVLARYLRAWNELDIGAFTALLHDEVKTTMPPSPTWIDGRADNTAFYEFMFAAQRPRTFFATETAANGQTAFAFYRTSADDDPYRLRAIQLVTLRDGKVTNIDHFMLPELATAFGLPREIPRSAGDPVAAARSCVELAAEALSRR